jgi:hypothetical protein
MAAEAGLKPYECDQMSPNDIWVYIEGYEERMKGEWERMRITAYTIHAHSMVDKKAKKNSPQKFFPLPWDKNREVKVAKGPQDILDWHAKLKAKNANINTKNAG